MKTLSIKAKTGIILVSGSLLVALCSVVVFTVLAGAKSDADTVDAAGRQRMLSQAMSKSIMGYALSRNELASLKFKVAQFDSYITKMRGAYTRLVIGAAKEEGVRISMKPEQEPHPAVPFPATFARKVGEAFAAEGGMSVTILAEDPINLKMGLQDAIDREAYAALRADSTRIFSKPVEVGGKMRMRFYTADKATVQACASCHTSMKGKPFKVGDMLGVRRYDMAYAEDVALGRQRLEPSLAEYESARKVFVQTLEAFRTGGEYPLDLEMTRFRTYTGTNTEAIEAALSRVESVWHKFEQEVQKLLQATPGSDAYWRAYQEVMSGSNLLRQVSNELTWLYNERAHSSQQWILWSVIAMLLFTLAGFGIIYLLFNRAVINPVIGLVAVANRIAEGDLTQKLVVPGGGKDEVGMLAKALNTVSGNLNTMVSKINSTARLLSDSTARIVDVSRQMEQGAGEQAEQTHAVAGSMKQMEVTSREMSQHADEATSAASQASEVAVKGGEIVRHSINGMVQVSATVQESAEKVEQLARHSEQIDQIVSVIEDIANQTNLLALNAAIEAARAGEQGRGFAVVADEVRGLANRTTDATKEIADMVKVIQSGTEAAVVSMEAGRKEAEQGVEMANQAGDSLEQIVGMVDGLSSRIQQIASATLTQSSVTRDVTSNVSVVTGISEQTEKDARLCSASSSELAKLAVELREMVGQFKI